MKRFCRGLKKCLRHCRCGSLSDEDDSDGLELPVTEPAPEQGVLPKLVYPKHLVPKAPPPPKDAAKQTEAAKPTQAPKPASPKKETKPQEEATSDREGNSSDEEYPPLPPSRDDSHTGITPELSDVDINDNDASDVEMPDADPAEGLFPPSRNPSPIPRNNPTIELLSDAPVSESSSGDYLFFGSARPRAPEPAPKPQHQSGQRSQPFSESRKRAHIENIADSPQEWSAASESLASSPPKRARASAASLQTEAQLPAGPQLSPPRLQPSTPPPERSDSASSDIDVEERLYPKPSESTLNTYREKGAQLAAWLEDPNEPNCYVAPATLTLHDMIHAQPPNRFQVGDSYHRNLGDNMDGGDPDSTGLTTEDNKYRYTSLRNPVTDPAVLAEHGFRRMDNSYAHLIGPGLIIGHSIFRYDNLQWNIIARALYVNDHPIETLRHIMFTCVINEETGPYVRRILYARFNREFEAAIQEPCLKVERGTREFEELLGTKLGKAAAILLLSSLPRGTRRISRAVVWNSYFRVELRFEIEPIPANPDDEPETAQAEAA
ncbi:hypothetical protein PEX1_017100 [Penicillium expansum]|uniref:Uncharacterized protein n=1 Tax=Penicillium expansum TaxID=27334 RepID=A0A0A2JDC5_PENEN|nr:hypothetical protein PEX2_060340 [Penicillium expansum]KGO44772.1 hypothetical protein PEX1_017100 [Penicillium expansum]KGO46722.1 hypothetical protein PEXP_068920 [Penicillium expansum]KGO53427.1 hypothetical protein PEX2_060340 [Penicillium expansum]